MILLDGWARSPTLENGFFLLIPEGVTQVAEERWDFVESKVRLGTFDNREQEKQFEEMRNRMDTQREVYIEHIKNLKNELPDFDFGWWLEMAIRRPTKTEYEIYTGEWHRDRRVGFCILTNSTTGDMIDYLAIDELGLAETLGHSSWFKHFASHWMSMEAHERPEIGKFINHLDGKNPPQSLDFVSQAQTLMSQGSLLTIARTLANSITSGTAF